MATQTIREPRKNRDPSKQTNLPHSIALKQTPEPLAFVNAESRQSTTLSRTHTRTRARSAWGAVCGCLVENVQGLLNQLHCVPRSIPPGTDQIRQRHWRVGGCVWVSCRKHTRSAQSIALRPKINSTRHQTNPAKTSAGGGCVGSVVKTMQGLLDLLRCPAKSILPSTDQIRRKSNAPVLCCRRIPGPGGTSAPCDGTGSYRHLSSSAKKQQ